MKTAVILLLAFVAMANNTYGKPQGVHVVDHNPDQVHVVDHNPDYVVDPFFSQPHNPIPPGNNHGYQPISIEPAYVYNPDGSLYHSNDPYDNRPNGARSG